MVLLLLLLRLLSSSLRCVNVRCRAAVLSACPSLAAVSQTVTASTEQRSSHCCIATRRHTASSPVRWCYNPRQSVGSSPVRQRAYVHCPITNIVGGFRFVFTDRGPFSGCNACCNVCCSARCTSGRVQTTAPVCLRSAVGCLHTASATSHRRSCHTSRWTAMAPFLLTAMQRSTHTVKRRCCRLWVGLLPGRCRRCLHRAMPLPPQRTTPCRPSRLCRRLLTLATTLWMCHSMRCGRQLLMYLY